MPSPVSIISFTKKHIWSLPLTLNDTSVLRFPHTRSLLTGTWHWQKNTSVTEDASLYHHSDGKKNIQAQKMK